MKRKTRRGDTPLSQFAPRLSKQQAAVEDRSWLVLRNKTRRRILDVLSRHSGMICVSELVEVLEETPSVVSGHLALLRAVHMVTVESDGSYMYYCLKKEQLNKYKAFLESL